jgi:predicted  nucleic acid-binding Zn-ribbon protein
MEQSIENYDKYQKARLILRELLNASVGNSIQDEVIRTSEEILKLEWEIDELSLAFQQLEGQNKDKDEEIAKYRKTVIDLTKAYE